MIATFGTLGVGNLVDGIATHSAGRDVVAVVDLAVAASASIGAVRGMVKNDQLKDLAQAETQSGRADTKALNALHRLYGVIDADTLGSVAEQSRAVVRQNLEYVRETVFLNQNVGRDASL